MADDGGLRFAEKVLSLVDTGRKSATYKLATLLALIDVVAESSGPLRGAPDAVSGRQVALRVIELYWPQSAVFSQGPDGEPSALRQSPQNDIPAKLHTWRQLHRLGARASLAAARSADPKGWERLERELIATVLRMPIPKLQRFGDSKVAVEDRFIYDFMWRDEEPKGNVLRIDFDDRLHLCPGAGEYLVRLAPLLRPAIQNKWVSQVARQNADLVDAHQLDEFLFGATRIDLTPVRDHLVEVQDRRCFYCDKLMRERIEVDHFIPWSRHPDNALDNLVASHGVCNGSKSAAVAAHEHLERWVHRLNTPVLNIVADDVGWPRRRDRTLGIVSATYRWLPEGSQLWLRSSAFEIVDPDRVRQVLALAA
jgi:hypothetical protein